MNNSLEADDFDAKFLQTKDPFDLLKEGRRATMRRQMAPDAIREMGNISHDTLARQDLLGGFVSAVLGMQLPGPGAIYRSHTVEFDPENVPKEDSQLITTVTVAELEPEKRRVKLEVQCRVAGKPVLTGTVELQIPKPFTETPKPANAEQ